MEDIILSTKNLTKKYHDNIAVNQVSLELQQGKIYGLVGKNGAGKTTLLRMITGQAFLTEGEISLFHSASPQELNRKRRRIGAMIETPCFYPYLTAAQNLEYYRKQRGIPGKECIEEVLSEVGLSDTGNKNYKSFSLGMKQRLGLALALMNKPELLLLDEPINGLDPFGIVEIRNMLLRLNQEKNITILVSSHILSELANLVTDYGFIDKGRMVKQISSEDLSRECTRYIELKVDKVEDMAALLETGLHCTSYTVMPDRTIRIYEYLNQPSTISELAVKSGMALSMIAVKEINLEDYFMNLVGGEKHV
jgi:ABC-2 type transport system ATP-binding protein